MPTSRIIGNLTDSAGLFQPAPSLSLGLCHGHWHVINVYPVNWLASFWLENDDKPSMDNITSLTVRVVFSLHMPLDPTSRHFQFHLVAEEHGIPAPAPLPFTQDFWPWHIIGIRPNLPPPLQGFNNCAHRDNWPASVFAILPHAQEALHQWLAKAWKPRELAFVCSP